MLRKSILLFFCAVCCLFSAQCGLEQAVLPWTAPTKIETSGSTYIFQTGSDHYSDPNRSFLGYEVYYKIAEGLTNFNSDDFNLTNPDDLASHGFKRLYSSNDKWSSPSDIASPPLLATIDAMMQPPNGPYTITIDFSGIQPFPDLTEATVSAKDSFSAPAPVFSMRGSSVSSINVRRAVQSRALSTDPDEYGRFKRFNAFYSGDTDVVPAEMLNGHSNNDKITVYMAIYVYAYGRSLNNATFMQEIKSPLCNLSYNQLNFYYNDEQS